MVVLQTPTVSMLSELFNDPAVLVQEVGGLKFQEIVYSFVPCLSQLHKFAPGTRQPPKDEYRQRILAFAVSARTLWRKTPGCAHLKPTHISVRLIHYPAQAAVNTIKPRVYSGFLISREFDTHGPKEWWWGADSKKLKPDKRGEWAESGESRFVVEVTVSNIHAQKDN